MKRNTTICLIMTAGVLLGTSGCDVLNLFGGTRTSDGGGGNIITASLKVASGQMTTLTQDELQVLNDQVTQLIRATNPSLPQLDPMTNEQANANLDFLQQNSVPGSDHTGLNSIQDIQAFVEAASATPEIIVVPQSLIDAYADTELPVEGEDFDVETLLQTVFGSLNTQS